VTGGAGGLGRAIAAALYGDGANVVISGRTPETLESAAEAITSGSSGGSVSAIPVDTRDDQSVAAMVDRTIATHGRIDFLVNCAARPGLDYVRDRPGIATFDEELFMEDIQTKVLGYLRCIRAVAPHMIERGYGRIVNVSGLSARRTSSITGSVRNVAVAAMTKNVADELGPLGVNVTVVHPGLTSTDVVEQTIGQIAAREGVTVDDVTRRFTSSVSIGRLVKGEEVAAVVAFLCSPLSVSINGDAVACGGGDLKAIHY
jgi:NAD(P)-dependent dehydrogenase (short-subunit alcohol dehydrogenase family)